METTTYEGSTSQFVRVQKGEVLKYPRQIWEKSKLYDTLTKDIDISFSVERQILERLEYHPRIVKWAQTLLTMDIQVTNIMSRYLGPNQGEGDPRGVLLAEASHGNLQQCLDENKAERKITLATRKKWCLQAVEAITYIHQRGIVHADLRPENFLIHQTTPMSLDLWLCDFGGSKCDELDIYGGHLPDSGFFDPRLEPCATTQMDIFSTGSVLYAILTDHWPFQESGTFKSPEEMNDYGNKVDNLFLQGIFPNVGSLFAGDIIMKCWTNQYASAETLLQSLQAEMDRTECRRFWLANLLEWFYSKIHVRS